MLDVDRTITSPAGSATRAEPAAALPDEVLDRQAALEEAADQTTWAYGDFLAETVDELGQYQPKAEVRRLLAAASQRYQPSTVRKREAVARFFDEATRDEFAALSYSHFELAKRQKTWREDLEWCLDSAADYGGRPAPLRVYAAMVKARNGGQKPTDPYATLEKVKAMLGEVADDASAPASLRAQAEAALNVLLEG